MLFRAAGVMPGGRPVSYAPNRAALHPTDPPDRHASPDSIAGLPPGAARRCGSTLALREPAIGQYRYCLFGTPTTRELAHGSRRSRAPETILPERLSRHPHLFRFAAEPPLLLPAAPMAPPRNAETILAGLGLRSRSRPLSSAASAAPPRQHPSRLCDSPGSITMELQTFLPSARRQKNGDFRSRSTHLWAPHPFDAIRRGGPCQPAALTITRAATATCCWGRCDPRREAARRSQAQRLTALCFAAIARWCCAAEYARPRLNSLNSRAGRRSRLEQRDEVTALLHPPSRIVRGHDFGADGRVGGIFSITSAIDSRAVVGRRRPHLSDRYSWAG